MGFNINSLKFLLSILIVFPLSSRAQLIINEVSQGPTGAQEYVELLVVGTPTCNAIPCIDIRGYYIDDNNGNHATGTGTGIASGCVRLTQDALWSCVPIGTIIVIYNDADINTGIPAQDLSLSDGNCTLVIPISNCTLFEKNISTPSTASATYPTSGFSACGSWTNISMANSDDSFQTIDASGNLVFSVSWGNNSTSDIIYFSGGQGGMVCSMTNSTDNNPNTQSNWTSGVVAGNQTPGSPNNAANAAWINSMNNSCTALVPLTLTTSQTSAGCTCAGTASVTASGAIAPYTYSWAPSGGTSATASGLCPNTYTVTVTSSNGCVQTATVIISADTPPVATTTVTSINCFGGTGSATVTASGGTTPYNYSWAPSGGTSATASSLANGTYTVTVTDAHSCTTTATANITQPTVLAATAAATPASCFNGSTGSATVTASGGTSPYSYSWSPSGGTSVTASSLIHGIYTVTVTDAHNCTVTATANVTQPTVLTAATTVTPASCFGESTGSATVTASGGTSPYSYSWAPLGGTASTASSLANGTYTATITDANSCTVAATANVTQPTQLTASVTSSPANCGASDGSASVTAAGGSGSYSYSWTSPGGNSSNAINLPSGNYNVTVTDINLCSITTTVNVGSLSTLSVTANPTSVSCFNGNDGSASTTVTGGTGPFSYAWSPSGGTGATATSLLSGSYTVTVSDANACIAYATVSITQPAQLAAGTSAISVTCFGGSDGGASVTANGGTSPYFYSWSPAGGNSSTASFLSIGIYTVTVTDAKNCAVTATANVVQPVQMTATTTATPAGCFGGSDGAASVTAGNGVTPYSYSWAPSGGNTSSAASLSNGTYTVTITDAHNCSVTATATVTEPTVLSGTASSSPATCGMNNGSASVIASGGTGSYTYSWLPVGSSGSSVNNLAAGNYSVIITDANSCTVTATTSVNNIATLSLTTSTNSVSCFGGSNGSATANVTGGTPLSYSWAPGGQTTASINNITAGNYTVTVTDTNNCITTAIGVVSEPPALTAATAVTPVSCFGGTDGSATVTASGGTPPYAYSWTPSGGTSSTASSLSGKNYTVTVTDGNSCTFTTTINVAQPTLLTATATATPVNCFGENNGSATVIAAGGTFPYAYAWNPSGESSATAASLFTGTYTVTVTDANNCTVISTCNVTQPAQLNATISSTPSNCNHSDGSAAVVVSGGTAPYTYNWNGSSSSNNNDTLSNIVPGNYAVDITDANSCQISATVTVNNIAGIIISQGTITPPLCSGGTDGSANVNVTGGTLPYTYIWSGGQNTASVNNLSAGNYCVAASDANGCKDSLCFVLTQPGTFSVTTTGSVICSGQTSTLSAVTAGGVSPFNFNWNGGVMTGTTIIVSPVSSNTYSVQATDANGCSATDTALVAVFPPLSVVAASDDTICSGALSTLSALASGGNGNYSLHWMPINQNGNNISVSPAANTTYTVTLTDGCTISPASDSLNIIVAPMPVIDFAADSLSGCKPLCVNFSDATIVSGGNVSSWQWTFGDGTTSSLSNPHHCYPVPGFYSVSLAATSSAGCTSSAIKNNYIDVYPIPVAEFTSDLIVTDILDASVNFTDQSTGATIYSWDFGDSTLASSLQNPSHTYNNEGTFTITLTASNSNGCTDNVTHEIVVNSGFTFYAPNAFSPNNDSINEIFLPLGTGWKKETFKLWVYDRWGNLIYDTNETDKGWDGRANHGSNIAQEDVYVWKVDLVDIFEKKHHYLGKVTIVK